MSAAPEALFRGASQAVSSGDPRGRCRSWFARGEPNKLRTIGKMPVSRTANPTYDGGDGLEGGRKRRYFWNRITAWVRLETPSFCSRLETCALTVVIWTSMA